jgi:hypothetical protein
VNSVQLLQQEKNQFGILNGLSGGKIKNIVKNKLANGLTYKGLSIRAPVTTEASVHTTILDPEIAEKRLNFCPSTHVSTSTALIDSELV